MLVYHRPDGLPVPTGPAPFERDEIQIVGQQSFRPLAPIGPTNFVTVEEVAHGLSLKNRWGGQCSDVNGEPLAYTVAQHAVHVADLVQMARQKLVPGWNWDEDESPGLYGLHHDDSEAYIDDIVRPVKRELVEYGRVEAVLQDGLLSLFKVPLSPGIKEAVRRVDDLMIFLERDALMGKPHKPYGNECDHPRLSIFDVIPDFYVWTPAEAKRRYIAKHYELVEAGRAPYQPLEYRGRGYGL